MSNPVLSQISISKSVLHLNFDTGDSVAAYDGIEFISAEGLPIARVNVGTPHDVVFPAHEFIGLELINYDTSGGMFRLFFAGGNSISIMRINSSNEIGFFKIGNVADEII